MKLISKNAIQLLVGIIIFFAAWSIGARVYGIELILPKPSNTIKAMGGLFANGSFWIRMGNSFRLTLISFAISFVLALLFATLGQVYNISRVFSPIITAVRSLPTMALILLLLIWFTPNSAPVMLGLLVVMPTMYSSFLLGMTSIKTDFRDTAKVFGANRYQLVRYIYLPLLKRSMVENTATGISLSFKLVLSAEIMAGTQNSLGQLMQIERIQFKTAELLATALAVCILCIVFEHLIRIPLRRMPQVL